MDLTAVFWTFAKHNHCKMHLQSYEVSWNSVQQWRVGKYIGTLLFRMNGSSRRTNILTVFESALTGGVVLPGRDSRCREYRGGSSALSHGQFTSSSAAGATGWVLPAACVLAAVDLGPGSGNGYYGFGGPSSLDGLVSIRGIDSCVPDP